MELLPVDGIRRLSDVRRRSVEIADDPRLVRAILDESRRILRKERVLIVWTHHGFVCANASIDHSNVSGDDAVSLLPVDCDASAARLRKWR
jgi:coenzyme F420-0:L-glutamate ligase/coenzyme F420-1:gamma-L-glutamate ligase